MMASASRDQTVRVFDIRAMKEFRVLKGHKKEVCCELQRFSHCPSPLLHVIRKMFFYRYSVLTTMDTYSCSQQSFSSRNLAPNPPPPSLRRLRRVHPTLGPLIQHRSASLLPSINPPRPARHALPGTRLERLVSSLPPTRAHPRDRVERPYDALLVSRAAGRFGVGIQWGRGEAAGCGGRWTG